LGLLKLRTMKAKIDKKEDLHKNLEKLMEILIEKGAVSDWKKEEKKSRWMTR